MNTVDAFIGNWTEDPLGTKRIFTSFMEEFKNKDGVKITVNERPGISCSFRLSRDTQTNRSLFCLMDVIDDDPTQRWLSVCFYEDMINDPDERGDLIPEGLSGDDGYCFDIDEADDELGAYVAKRILEAYDSAEKNP